MILIDDLFTKYLQQKAIFLFIDTDIAYPAQNIVTS